MPKDPKPDPEPKPPKNGKIEYILAQALSINRLEAEVNRLIDEGWEPIGGACCMRHAPRVGIFAGFYTRFLAQAMIRKKEKN